MKRSRMSGHALYAISMCAGVMLSASVLAADDKMDAVGAEMKMMDTNHDGKVSAGEHAAGAKAMYDKMDADHNGQVTTAEMDASHKAMMKGKDTSQDMSSAGKIKTMDTNNDVMLSAEEHAAGAKNIFDGMDNNHDGQLSEDEMRIGHDAMMGAKKY